MGICKRIGAGLRALALGAAAAATGLAGCGGGGDDAGGGSPAGVRLESAAAVSATIGAAGGSLTAVAADGRRYTLTVPVGALATDTTITATPVASMGDAPLAAGTRGAVRFGPAGTRFAFPATLRIEGVATAVAGDRRLVGFVRSDDGTRMQLVPAGTVGGALELPVPHFSDVGASEATAAELALVPLTTPETVTEEIWTDILRRDAALTRPAGLANRVAVFNATVDSVIAPLQAAAATSTEAEVRESGVTAYSVLTQILVMAFESDELSRVITLMEGRLERTRNAAAELLRADFDRGLAECTAAGPAGSSHDSGLATAAAVTALLPAQDEWPQIIGMSLQTSALGLDGVTLRRRLNDCARVVFVPRAQPAFEAGRSVSLDQRAALVFAVDATREVAQPFDFEVQGIDGDVATPRGFSDVQGLYTTVVTPRSVQAQFASRACWMVPLRSGARVASGLCGTQTVGRTTTDIILAGTLDIVRPETGRVQLRVRVEPNGRYTVLLAFGSITLGDGSVVGIDEGVDVAPSLSLRNGGFELFDRDRRPPFRLFIEIHAIERDAEGVITALHINYDGVSRNPGVLRRE